MSHRPLKVIRIKHVAQLAGVSTATVSRIFKDHGPASEAARSRVLRAAQQLDYHPNWPARSLRGRRTKTFGLMFPDGGGFAVLPTSP